MKKYNSIRRKKQKENAQIRIQQENSERSTQRKIYKENTENNESQKYNLARYRIQIK